MSRLQSQCKPSARSRAVSVILLRLWLRSAKSVKSFPQTEIRSGVSSTAAAARNPSNGSRMACTMSGRRSCIIADSGTLFLSICKGAIHVRIWFETASNFPVSSLDKDGFEGCHWLLVACPDRRSRENELNATGNSIMRAPGISFDLHGYELMTVTSWLRATKCEIQFLAIGLRASAT